MEAAVRAVAPDALRDKILQGGGGLLQTLAALIEEGTRGGLLRALGE